MFSPRFTFLPSVIIVQPDLWQRKPGKGGVTQNSRGGDRKSAEESSADQKKRQLHLVENRN